MSMAYSSLNDQYLEIQDDTSTWRLYESLLLENTKSDSVISASNLGWSPQYVAIVSYKAISC